MKLKTLCLTIILQWNVSLRAQFPSIENSYLKGSKEGLFNFLIQYSFHDSCTSGYDYNDTILLSYRLFNSFHKSRFPYFKKDTNIRIGEAGKMVVSAYPRLPDIQIVPKIHYSDSETFAYISDFYKRLRNDTSLSNVHLKRLDSVTLIDWIIAEAGPYVPENIMNRIKNSFFIDNTPFSKMLIRDSCWIRHTKELDSAINNFILKYPRRRRRIASRLKFIQSLITVSHDDHINSYTCMISPVIKAIYFDKDFSYALLEYQYKESIYYSIYLIKDLKEPLLLKDIYLLSY